jgi:hypothetical protein
MNSTVVVIGRQPGETSCGPLAVGERARIPLEEAAVRLATHQITLADWREQEGDEPQASIVERLTTAVETIAPAVKPKRRYRRRDLRAEK